MMIKGHIMAYDCILSTVTSLDLLANNLSGQIFEDMGYIRGLRSLNISHNQLTNFIPHELDEIEN